MRKLVELNYCARDAVQEVRKAMMVVLDQRKNATLEERESLYEGIHKYRGYTYDYVPDTMPYDILIHLLELYLEFCQYYFFSTLSDWERDLILKSANLQSTPDILYIQHIERELSDFVWNLRMDFELKEKKWRLREAKKWRFPFIEKWIFPFIKKWRFPFITGRKTPPLNWSVPVQPFFDFLNKILEDEKNFKP